MPILKVNIEKEQQERIEKQYFEKIAKKKPDQLTLYKKCYYAEKLSSFTKEEKKLRERIRQNIIWTYRYRSEESFKKKQGRGKLIELNKLKKAKEEELRKAKERELKEANERELKEVRQKEKEWHLIPDYGKNKIVKKRKLPKEKILSCAEIQKRLSGFTISKNSQRSKKFKFTTEQEKKIVEDRKKMTMTNKEIGEKWNCHEQTILKILKRHYERNTYKTNIKAY